MEKGNILIVEDDRLIALELQRILSKEGYRPVIAASPEEAILSAEQNQPNLILMDILLKNDKDGINTIQEIRKKFDIPHIFISAMTDEETLSRAKASNPASFLVKPIDEKELFNNIAITLSNHELERKLKDIEQRYNALYNNSGTCVFIIGFDEMLIEVNKAGMVLLGYSKDEMMSLTLKDVLPEEELTEAREIIQALKEDRDDFRRAVFKLKDKNKNTLFIDVHCSVIEKNNNTYAIQVIAKDITEKFRNEEIIRRSEEKYRTLFERMAQGVIYHDPSGIILSLNPAAERILGFQKEIVGKSVFDSMIECYYPDGSKCPPEEYPVIIAIKEHREVTNQIIGIVNLKDKKIRWVNISAVPLFREGENNPFEVFISFEEITDLKASKERAEEALKEKEALIKEVHHRVKNNFQVISSLLSLQSDKYHDPESLNLFNESRNRIRIMAMIHELLYQANSFSRISSYDYMTRLINYLMNSYNINRDQILILSEIEDLPLSVDSAICCGQIINETISNAYKYAFPEKRKGEISIIFKKQNEKHILKISDNGIGFSKAPDLKNMESLGLTLVNTFVMQLNGNIQVNTGSGTEYIITFVE